VVTTVRKLLLAVLLVSLAGSAFGAGTFATFNASTTNAGSTFATGTLVLSNKVNSTTTCLSTGAGTNTDTNANSAGCGTLFATTVSKPGDTATVDLDLQGVGTLSATKLQLFAASLCATTQNTAATPYTGTGDLCEQTQITVQESTSAANRTAGTASRCWFGGVGAGTIASTSNITFPLTITASTNDMIKLTINTATVLDNVIIPAGVYANPFTLAAAIQTALRTAATNAPGKQVLVGGSWVTTGATGTITFSTPTPGATGNVTIATPTTAARTALASLGFVTGATNTGSSGAVACTSDSAHSVEGLTSAYTNATNTPMLDLGPLTTGAPTTRFLRISLTLPSTAGNDVQGRLATFGLTWRIDQ
jgi:hypothetical protein